jgi:hypothetical protein
MQLRHLIAQCRNIHFVGLRMLRKRLGRMHYGAMGLLLSVVA